jgi:hypothetical protein
MATSSAASGSRLARLEGRGSGFIAQNPGCRGRSGNLEQRSAHIPASPSQVWHLHPSHAKIIAKQRRIVVTKFPSRLAIALALAAILQTAHAAKHPAPPAPPADPMEGIDTDNDGTISLDEATLAASAKFDSLDTSLDGKISRDESKGHISLATFKEADTSKNKFLSKDEFMALVTKRFKAADHDSDGTIDAEELKTPAGRALVEVIK